MALVRGHDAYTAVEFQEQGTDWDTPGSQTGADGIAILNESLTLQRDQFPKLREFGTIGAVTRLDQGRKFVQGSVTWHPRYDDPATHILLAQFMGSETVIANDWVDGSTASGCHTHNYAFSSTISDGVTIWVHKSGAGTTGFTEKFTGCIPTRMVWELPADDAHRITMDFFAKTVEAVNTSTLTAPATPAGSYIAGARDLSNSMAMLRLGDYGSDYPATDLNVRRFTLTADRRYEADPAFMNDVDNLEKPGIVDTRDIFLDLEGQLEQMVITADHPYFQFVNKTEGAINIILDSGTVAAASHNYAFRINLPRVVWENASQPLADGGVANWTARCRGIRGDVHTQAGFDDSGGGTVGVDTPSDLRLFAANVTSGKHSIL